MLKLPNAILIKTFRAILQIEDAPYPLSVFSPPNPITRRDRPLCLSSVSVQPIVILTKACPYMLKAGGRIQ